MQESTIPLYLRTAENHAPRLSRICGCNNFTGGCNFRCPFCHNSEILGNDAPPLYSPDDILAFLKKRSRILDGVCISGGEPCLQPEALEDFILQVRSLGLHIKLDTNGSRPQVIRHLAEQGLLDYIAMDIKAGPEHYPAVCGVSPDIDSVQESVQWLLSGVVPFEFRTTAVKGLHTSEDFRQIGPWIAGCPDYYIQNYVPSERVLHQTDFLIYKRRAAFFCGNYCPLYRSGLIFAESITNGSTGVYPYTSIRISRLHPAVFLPAQNGENRTSRPYIFHC